MTKPKRLNMRISPKERAKLHALASRRGLSMSGWMSMMIADAYRETFGDTPPPQNNEVGAASTARPQDSAPQKDTPS